MLKEKSMLKKKGFLKAFLALVFCFSLFGGNILLNTKSSYNAGAASDFSGLEQTSSDGNWSYVAGNDSDTLYLSGVELCGQITLKNDLNIVLQNGTTSTIYCDEDAIFVSKNGQKKLTISGKGTLILETEDPLLVFCNGDGNTFSSINFDGFTCENRSGETADDGFSGNYYKFTRTSSLGGVYSESDTSTGEPSTDETTESGTTLPEHTHNFSYRSSGATLTATCSADSCDLTGNSVSVTLVVADVDYGTTPTATFDLTTFNEKTGLSLSLEESYFSQTFYKTSAEGITSGGEIISGFNAGFYYLKLSSRIDSPIGTQNLYCAFKINKISAGTFSGVDAKFSLTHGKTYDVSNMFTLPDDMTGSYEIVDEGATGDETLVGSTLSFNDAGVCKIKCTTSGSENYLSEDLTKTLTITKPLNFTVTLSDWDEDGEASLPTISLTGKTATFAYFTNEDCTIKTTTTNGAIEEGGKPTGAGVYYVKATIAEDGIYEESSAKARFVIWTTPTISLKSSTNTVRFNNLPYTEETVYKNVDDLFNLDANCGMATYYLVNGSTEEIISDAKLIITEVKTYLIRVKTAAENCYKASQYDCELTIQKAVFNLGANATVPDVEYGKTIQVVINERTFGAIETLEFYTDAACDNDHKLSTNPTEPRTYYVVINLAETNVSESASTTKSFTITKKKITDIIWSTLDYVYNGNEQSVNVFYKDINGTNIPLAVTYKDAADETVTFKNVGEYKITVDFATENEKKYYEFSSSVDTFKNYSIGKVVLVYQIKNSENNYGELTSSDNLSFRVQLEEGDPIRGEAVPYTLKLEDDTLTINETLPMGKYKIVGTCDDPNYDVTFLPGYLVIKNKILSIDFPDWTYDPDNTEPRVPVVTAIAGADDVKFYYTPYEEEAWVETQPTKPGAYRLKVEVNTTATEDYLQASDTKSFIISKITVKKPAENNTVFTYNGKEQIYTLEESVYYTVNNSRKTSAGNYIVTVKLKNPEYYKWEDDTSSSEATRDYDFVINKRAVEKPLKNEKVFKYNGKYQNYFNFTSEESEIYRLVKEDDNSQKDVGTYTLYIELVDKVNTVWSDGTTKEIAYEFVINQANISQPVAKNDSGEELENSPVTIVETGESGFDPETELHVSVLTSSDTSKMEAYRYLLRTDLPTSFSKYDKVFAVYNISLMNGEDKITSEEKFILKLDIPTELKNGVFDLYKVYKDESGDLKTEKIEYLAYDGSVYLESNGESCGYVFVYEQSSLKALVIIFSVASGILLLTLALQIYFLFIKKNKKSKKKNAKNIGLAALVAPTFYVHSEVVASIVLGVVMGVLILANVALFILYILKRNKQKKLNLQIVTGEEQKPKNKKTKKIIQKGNLVLSETTEENSIENNSTTEKDAKEKTKE